MTITDKIIKGLESCVSPCTIECPYMMNGCVQTLLRECLEYIKMREEDIEVLSGIIESMKGDINNEN